MKKKIEHRGICQTASKKNASLFYKSAAHLVGKPSKHARGVNSAKLKLCSRKLTLGGKKDDAPPEEKQLIRSLVRIMPLHRAKRIQL